MNLMDFVEAWWLSVRPLVEVAGAVGRFERSPANRPNPSCVLNLRRNELEADLLVWESGEAELATTEHNGSINHQHSDDIRTPADLSALLSRLINVVSDARSKAFLLWHSRPIEGGIDEKDTDDKLVGVYSSVAEADAAKRRKLQFEGFRDYPECFHVVEYELNNDAWTEGFISGASC